MAEASERTTGGEGRTRLLLRALAIVLALAAAYFAFVWLQLENTQSRGAEIEKNANGAILSLNAGINLLRENPGSAPEIAPQLETTRKTLDELAQSVGQLNASVLPPGADARRAYRDALRSYVSDIEGYNSELTTTTALVAARTETVKKVSEGFAQLEKLSDPGITEASVSATLRGVKAAVDASLDSLRSISASATTVYSSEALIARLSAISAVVDELVKSLQAKEQGRLDGAVRSFAQLMNGDWQSLFLQYDMRGLGKLATNMRGLSERREKVSGAQKSVVSAQKLTGLLGLACFLGALVSAGIARWR